MINKIKLEDYLNIIDTIYENRYFSNHGPQAQQLEFEIESYCKFENVITVGSDVIALLIALNRFVGKNRVFIPKNSCQKIYDVISISGISSQIYDKKKLSDEYLKYFLKKTLMEKQVSILLYEEKYKAFDSLFLNNIVKFGFKLIIYSENILLLNSGTNLSKDITFIYPLCNCLNASAKIDGGIIATNSNSSADIFRNIRSSYGVRKKVDVLATCNGRFSELQAGLGLVLLDKFRDK